MPVPLILSQPASEFGDHIDSAAFADPNIMDRDMSYVPGFSDLRRQRDLKVAEYVNHRCAKSDIPELPVNVRWGRNQKIAGTPDSSKIFGHSLNGYRAATTKDISDTPGSWLRAMPPGAESNADGTIRKGDTILLVATKERAATNARRKAEATAQRVSGMEHGFAAQAQKDGTGWRGADPSVTKEVTSSINVPVAKAAGTK